MITDGEGEQPSLDLDSQRQLRRLRISLCGSTLGMR